MNVSSIRQMLDACLARPGIMIAYGHTSARSILRGGRAPELLTGSRAARGPAARGDPPDPLAREAPRPAARRPFGSAGRADGGRPAPLPERAAAARARG